MANEVVTNPKPAVPYRLFLSGWSVVFLSYFAVGYQNSVLNAASDVFIDFINSSYINHGYPKTLTKSGAYTLYSVMVSLWHVGCIFGSLFSYKIEEKLGRKRALLSVASSLQVFGSFLMVLAPIFDSFELLAIGRFVAGLSSGVICPTLRVFLCECCPNQYRGYLNSPGGLVVSIASLIAVVLAQPDILGTPQRIQYLLGICIVPSIAQLLISPCIPASPKFLYIEKGDTSEAVKSIFFYHGPDANVAKLFREYELEKRLASEQVSLKSALFNRSLRIPLILSGIISLAHSGTGIDIIEAYSTEIFMSIGMSALAAKHFSLVFNVPGIVAGVMAIFISDRCGRRPLLLCTMGMSIFANLVFIVLGLYSKSFGYHWAIGITAVTLTGVQAFFYALGPGAIAELLFAELSPQNIRAAVGSFSEFSFWIYTSIFVFAFPPLLIAVGPYSFLVFTVPLVMCVLYLAYALPETMGRSVIDIVDDYGSNENEIGPNTNDIDSCADFRPMIQSSMSSMSTSTVGDWVSNSVESTGSANTGPISTVPIVNPVIFYGSSNSVSS